MTEDVMTILEEMLEESELNDLLDKASKSDDPQAVFAEAYSAIVGDVDDSQDDTEDRMKSYGLSIEKIESTAFNQKTRESITVLFGYDIKLDDGESIRWMGKTLSLGHRHQSIPFASEDDARDAARIWMNLQEEKAGIDYPAPVNRTIKLPLCFMDDAKSLGRVQVHVTLNADESEKMIALLRGLRAKNIEMIPGVAITYAGVVKYILSQIDVVK